MGRGFSPLDEELRLLPGRLTPLMHAHAVRLGIWRSFGGAAREMSWHHHVTLSKEFVRRHTEQAGAAYEQEQTRVPETAPGATPPERQMLSVDGAMVHTTTGEWREVKTLMVAALQPEGKAMQPSYFSRMAEHRAFAAQAASEVQRRQVARSAAVCAVADGADYNQAVIDQLCPGATRILDFCHAAEHLAVPLRAVYGEDTDAFASHFQPQRHELRDGDPDLVLAALSDLATQNPPQAQVLNDTLGYLTKRRDQISYAIFQAAHWPIGSGAGEAAHKVVVEARLKQAGMRWAEAHINPLVALRNLVCNDRWEEGWPLITTHLRHPQRPIGAAPPPERDQVPTGLLPPGFTLMSAPSWRHRPVGKAQRLPSASASAKT